MAAAGGSQMCVAHLVVAREYSGGCAGREAVLMIHTAMVGAVWGVANGGALHRARWVAQVSVPSAELLFSAVTAGGRGRFRSIERGCWYKQPPRVGALRSRAHARSPH